jgi:integral membrane protein
MNLSSPVTRLRLFSLLDACSYIYLLYCAIYLKRMMGDDSAIRTPGMIHGIVFCLFGATLLNAWLIKKWSFVTIILIGITSLIPFAPFWLETWLKKQEKQPL